MNNLIVVFYMRKMKIGQEFVTAGAICAHDKSSKDSAYFC